MKSKVKKLTGTARELSIEMSGDVVEEAVKDILGEIKKTAKIPGFRPGNAPMDIIRKKHHAEALEEAKNRLIAESYQEALQKHGVDPASYPEISEIKYEDAGELSFKAKVDTYPEVNLKKYIEIPVTAKKVEVEDREIEDAIDRVRGMFARFVDKEGALDAGDFAVADVGSTIDGRPISEKRNNMWIEVSEENSLLGMGKELEGLEKGARKDIDVTLPENYPDEKYAGKKAVFTVEIKEVKVRELPEVDKDLAEKMGKETPEALREELRGQIMSQKQRNEEISMKNQIMADLIKKHRFDLPETMVARQFKVLMDRAENELTEKGLGEKAISEHKEKLRSSLLKEAEDKVRVYFILDEISKRENVEVSEEEIDSWISGLARSYNKTFEEVKKYYTEHDLIGGLYEQLKEGKTLDFLLEKASVRTV